MGARTEAPRRSTISQAELEKVLWRHRLKFRADYIREDMPYWKRYLFETLASDQSTEEKMIDIVLSVHADGATGENARPCLDRMQALSGLTRPTLVKYLNAKSEWREKTATGTGRAPNTYSVTIPQKTIDEFVALYGERSSKTALPLEADNDGRSSKATLPLDGSSKSALPLSPDVAVNGFNHYGGGKGRSGKNERCSGKAALPDSIDTKNKSKRENGTFLPKDWTLPDEWRDAARSMGLANPDDLARRFHRYYTSQNTPRYKKRFVDWREKWIEWVEREPHANGSRHPYGYHDDGMVRG